MGDKEDLDRAWGRVGGETPRSQQRAGSEAAPRVHTWQVPLGENTVSIQIECPTGNLQLDDLDALIEITTIFRRQIAAGRERDARKLAAQIGEPPNGEVSDTAATGAIETK
jgi:hypothetical protein